MWWGFDTAANYAMTFWWGFSYNPTHQFVLIPRLISSRYDDYDVKMTQAFLFLCNTWHCRPTYTYYGFHVSGIHNSLVIFSTL